jgi:hypothetical protein
MLQHGDVWSNMGINGDEICWLLGVIWPSANMAVDMTRGDPFRSDFRWFDGGFVVNLWWNQWWMYGEYGTIWLWLT